MNQSEEATDALIGDKIMLTTGGLHGVRCDRPGPDVKESDVQRIMTTEVGNVCLWSYKNP